MSLRPSLRILACLAVLTAEAQAAEPPQRVDGSYARGVSLVLRQGRVLAEGAPGDAALHAALALAFGGAFSIQPVDTPAGPRWVAVPAP